MASSYSHSKGWLRGAGQGVGVPRVWPHPDRASSPPPSHGGLWTGPRLLLGWCFTQIVCVDGPSLLFHLRIFALCFIKKVPFGIFSHVFVFMSLNTCGTWSIVNAYVFKIGNFSSFCVLIGGQIWLLRTTNSGPERSYIPSSPITRHALSGWRAW
jgi:hypothetical protein